MLQMGLRTSGLEAGDLPSLQLILEFQHFKGKNKKQRKKEKKDLFKIGVWLRSYLTILGRGLISNILL